ncbi:Utp21-domain-containing protein [Auriculariales sp. MPI-PUGE-AT-0066]|nr:Utp21-domain-containing protein [Auriculariales sp. MPI-PUGE-AT-0066]
MATAPDFESRPQKRARTQDSPAVETRQPGLFAPFRALGFVTNSVPPAIQTRAQKGAVDAPRIHIATCLGRAWALWEGGKMGLLFVGPDAPHDISSIALNGDEVWVASGPFVAQYMRGKETLRLENPLESNLSSILVFGPILLALTEDGKRLLLWDLTDRALKSMITFENGFTASRMMHPATYLNKILVASEEGSMQLWNIKTQKCIFTFEPAMLRQRLDTRNPGTITCFAQAAIDVVGIGFSTGELSVYDIQANELITRFVMDGGPLRAVAFRNGDKVVATANSAGHIAFWDLEEGHLLHILRGAHDSAVTHLEWIPGHPVLVSSGEDNAVKQWTMDSPTAPPRLLKFRSGILPRHGKALLSAAQGDRAVRLTSVVRDARSAELSQGPGLTKKSASLSTSVAALKLPAVTRLSASTNRARDWDNLLTAHKDEPFARSWSVSNMRLGQHVFAIPKKDDVSRGVVTAVHVSPCGNFSIAGAANGSITAWSIQSGLLRRSYTLPKAPPARKGVPSTRSISGLAIDALNRSVIASTLDGQIVFFDFHSGAVQNTLNIKSSVDQIELQTDSNLLAAVCGDRVVRIIDIETHRVVRELPCRDRIRDLTWSADSRWIVVACYDRVIRTFDVPSGRLVDVFKTPDVPTSIALSPTGDFLATTHANRAQYADVPLRTVNEDEVVEFAIPSVQGQAEEEALEALTSLTLQDSQAVFESPNQLADELVTLTLLPRAKWQTLLNLDVIAQRNKPKEAPKAPEQAPFFLPTLPGVEHRFAIETPETPPSRRLRAGATSSAESEFVRRLAAEEVEGDHEDFFQYTRDLSAAALDLEIRTGLVRLPVLVRFIQALGARLRVRRDFEAVQAMIGVLLRVHGEIIIENAEELQKPLEMLREVQRKESARVLELTNQALGTLMFVQAAP